MKKVEKWGETTLNPQHPDSRMRKAICRYFVDSGYRFLVNSSMGFYRSLPDDEFLKRKFKAKLQYDLDLENPQTFNEKLQWLKIYNRNPLYTALVDKYAVKEWVSRQIGEEYIIPTYGVWDSFDEIDFSVLPDSFVLKCTHDSGGLAICRDKRLFKRDKARKLLGQSLKQNYYWASREWPYKNVPPRIIAEEYLDLAGLNDDELIDYKFMCFNGIVRCVFTCTGRSRNDLRVDFFDPDWHHLPFERHYSNADELPKKPLSLLEMKQLAEKLSADIPFVRIDFYEVSGRPRFGEMTFFPGAGFEEFTPQSWDKTLGEWLELPSKRNPPKGVIKPDVS